MWIDFFRDVSTLQVAKLSDLFGRREIVVGDLVLTEVLQGIRGDRAFVAATEVMTRFSMIEVGGMEIALQAARNYRLLRAQGVTPRKTIDTLIATRCIADGHRLLTSDRDFAPFFRHLGLVAATD